MTIAMTPGIAKAAEISIASMRAWGRVLRRNLDVQHALNLKIRCVDGAAGKFGAAVHARHAMPDMGKFIGADIHDGGFSTQPSARRKT